MKRSDILKEIMEDIVDRLLLEGKMNQDEADDTKDDIDFNTPLDERDWLDNVQDLGVYKNFVLTMKKFDASSDDPDQEAPVFVERFTMTEDYKDELRSFWVNDTASKFSLITGLELNKFTTTNNPDESVIPLLSKIWHSIKDNSRKMENFWEVCNTNDSKDYYIVYNSSLTPEEAINAYGYAYLHHINFNKFEIPANISYSGNQPFDPNLTFDRVNPYRQYFDIFHVLIESKHCNDILRRYLHIYQVVEDLVYRYQIVEIAEAQLRKTGFLRHTIRIASGIKSEEDTFKKGVETLFPDLKNEISDVTVSTFDRFLENTYGIKPNNHSNSKLGKIIYSIRNSIVHNKHTEFHFSYGNITDYQPIIPLIKLIIEKLELQVINIINNSAIEVIDYPHPTIRVY